MRCDFTKLVAHRYYHISTSREQRNVAMCQTSLKFSSFRAILSLQVAEFVKLMSLFKKYFTNKFVLGSEGEGG